MINLVNILATPKDVIPWDFLGWKKDKSETITNQNEWNQTFLSVISGTAIRLGIESGTIYTSMDLHVKLLAGLKGYDYMTDKINGKFKIVIDKYIQLNRIVVTSDEIKDGIVIKLENIK